MGPFEFARMSHLIFVRHSVPNILPGIQASKWELSQKGIELAHILAIQLDSLEPNVVISSPENKAFETGAVIAIHFMVPHRSEVDIREHELDNKGDLLSSSEFNATVCRFFEYPNQIVFGKETARQALKRFTKAVDSIGEKNQGINSVVVTHGRILSLFVSEVTDMKPYEFWQGLDMPAFVASTFPELNLI